MADVDPVGDGAVLVLAMLHDALVELGVIDYRIILLLMTPNSVSLNNIQEVIRLLRTLHSCSGCLRQVS